METVKTLKKLHKDRTRPYLGLLHKECHKARSAGVWQPVDVVVGLIRPGIELQPDHRRRCGSALEGQSKGIYGIWARGQVRNASGRGGAVLCQGELVSKRELGLVNSITGDAERAPFTPGTKIPSGGRAIGSIETGCGPWESDFTLKKDKWDLSDVQFQQLASHTGLGGICACVDEASVARPLAGEILRWEGPAGGEDVRQVVTPFSCTDRSEGQDFPVWPGRGIWSEHRPPAFVLPSTRCENPTIIPAGQTVTVVPSARKPR